MAGWQHPAPACLPACGPRPCVWRRHSMMRICWPQRRELAWAAPTKRALLRPPCPPPSPAPPVQSSYSYMYPGMGGYGKNYFGAGLTFTPTNASTAATAQALLAPPPPSGGYGYWPNGNVYQLIQVAAGPPGSRGCCLRGGWRPAATGPAAACLRWHPRPATSRHSCGPGRGSAARSPTDRACWPPTALLQDTAGAGRGPTVWVNIIQDTENTYASAYSYLQANYNVRALCWPAVWLATPG